MSRRGRLALALTLVAAVLPIAACTGGDDITLTLTEDACAYAGPRSLRAGSLTVAVENESESPGLFGVLRIEDGRTFEDVKTHAEQELERIEEGQPLAGNPDWLTVVARAEAGPGARSTLSADVAAGAHAFACVLDSPASTGYVAGPLDVLP